MKAPARATGSDVDWQRVHARFAQAREVFKPSPERTEALLEARARRLAQPLSVERQAAEWLAVLSFKLGGESYGIETRYVQEVIRLAGLTPIPGVAGHIAGVANLRGQILAVFDIRPLLGVAATTVTEASRIVVCGDDEPDLGLLVDGVSDVLRVPAGDIAPDAILEGRPAETLVRGLTRDAVIVLDGPALLGDPRLFVDQPRRQ